MRIHRSSLQRFHSWRAGRIALPLGFLAVLAAGSHLVMTSGGDDTASAPIRVDARSYDGARHGGGYALGALDESGLRNLARPIVSPEEIALPVLEKPDARPAPRLVRAIEPSAVYKPQAAHAAANGAEHSSTQLVAYPSGVERFDQCKGPCDTRDPMLAPIAFPGPQAQEEDGLLDRTMIAPVISEARSMIDRTVDGAVSGTSAAYDAVKQTVSGALDFIR
ncbi:hypothetical protein MKI84_17800 [Ancylobacter sp. A5.8]|uniref:hypothetical protein n=1 Tax=Ancylobacter gelatini TaxID=2919920 RepID=UPI001F4EFD86|nr:hypothetical protein [Ancylobacter gelatini]MCJ8144778.1 hypothetical protein [Ancylobacter gelatini]